MATFLVVVVSKFGDWIEALSSVPLVKITFAITLIMAFRAGKLPSPIRAWSLRLARPAIAFQVLAIASVVWSIYKSLTLKSSLSAGIYLIALVLLVKIVMGPRDLYRLLKGMAVGAGLLAVGTLVQFAGGRAEMNAWNSNDIAYVLVTLLPVVLVQRVGRSVLVHVIVLSVALLMVIATLLTGSRGGLLGLGVVVALLAVFPLAADAGGRPKRFRAMTTAARLIPLVVVAGLIWTHLPSKTTERLATLEHIEGDYNMSADSQAGRLLIWRRDLGLALRRPIGYGLGTAAAVDGLLGGGEYRTAHNSLVEVIVELGVLGVAIYLTAYYRVWRGLAAVWRGHLALPAADSAQLLLYARTLSIAFVGNFVTGFFLSQAYSGLLWMLVAVCASFVRLGAPAYGVVASAQHPRNNTRQIGAKWV
jgi:O-Antigen ligase